MSDLQLSEPLRGLASEAESRRVTELEDYFDAKLAAEVGEPVETYTTTVRWSARQLAAIKRAAARFGMHYQTYVKDAAFRRALRDLADVDRVGV
jgi:predicted DNA binding CopG/RHH family protein